jgi:DnaJ family protein C protein 28
MRVSAMKSSLLHNLHGGFYRKLGGLSKTSSNVMAHQRDSTTPPEKRPPSRRRKPGEGWQSFVERQIQEAQAEGAFDNLPGCGKPLRLESVNPYAGSKELAHKILQDHGFAPDWIELDKGVRQELETARRCLANSYRRYGPDSAVWQRAVDRFAGQIAELNDKIDLYNLKAPGMSFQRRRILLADEIRRLEEGGKADG